MQAVDFVDEEDVALLDIGQNAGEIARFFDLRPRGGVELGPCSAGDEVGQGGLAQTRRAGEQDVVEHVAALFGGFQHQQNPLLDLFLADELRKCRRPQRNVEGCRGRGGGLLVKVFGHRAGSP